ncbi:uncharacterized protein L201_000726 [Kwoniella dendrophila CBS 6074]|uniref:C3H1-type domain-containing protein n=1 Tax=Kwoniella dendrophila CBS 6074 TaxID=1295534 RepID=A0AAX4JKE3_9TREE
MFVIESKPMSVESRTSTVRFASVEPERSLSTVSQENITNDRSIEVDLSTLIAQAQRQHDQEKFSSSSNTSDETLTEGYYKRKWDSQIPATAFGGMVRVEDDSMVDYNGNNHQSIRALSPLNGFNNTILPDIDGQQKPKTAPLPLPSKSNFFQPFADEEIINPNPPLTPQQGQIPNPNLVTSTNPTGLFLSSPPETAKKSNILRFNAAQSSADTVENVKTHLEGLSIHLSGLFDQVKQIDELKKEVKYWKDVCLGLEISKKDLENLVTQTQNQQGQSKFTTVLIDGDNYIFQQNLLQAGFEGGQEAAHTLLSAIKERTIAEKVITQVILNKSTLGATLIKNGVVPTWAKYDQFWQGFSSSSGLITVCDLGSGEEKAGAKLNDYLSLYSGNNQCDQIIIGASPELILNYEDVNPERVFFLNQDQSSSIPSRNARRTINIPDLFHTLDLVPLTAKPVISDKIDFSKDHVEVIDWSALNSAAVVDKLNNKSSSNNHNKIKIHSVTTSSTKDTLDEYDDLSPKRKFKRSAKYNKNAAEQVRKLVPRPCHTHYLSEWGCRDVDACSYGHGYHLSPPQLNELARMAKSVICPYMTHGKCRYDDKDCVYGHKCPNASKCPFGESCRFRAIPNGHGELE